MVSSGVFPQKCSQRSRYQLMLWKASCSGGVQGRDTIELPLFPCPKNTFGAWNCIFWDHSLHWPDNSLVSDHNELLWRNGCTSGLSAVGRGRTGSALGSGVDHSWWQNVGRCPSSPTQHRHRETLHGIWEAWWSWGQRYFNASAVSAISTLSKFLYRKSDSRSGLCQSFWWPRIHDWGFLCLYPLPRWLAQWLQFQLW